MKKESKLQSACVRWFRYAFPNDLIFAIPNGGSRNKLEAVNLKNEGVLAGVADLQVISKNKTLFIEMKTEKGRQNPNQKIFEERVRKLGFDYFVCRSFDEFQKVIVSNIVK
ncbi:VRR-NUC domain-containing protein [Capnocytophaga sp. ARDL2]|uniref:VRR-NUC domain-containing protein n=1 Tax=Capnocytophaga sp. ARDL2 TaxID=3238809 RepID=UPI00355803BC